MGLICSFDTPPLKKIKLPTQFSFGFAHATEFLLFLAQATQSVHITVSCIEWPNWFKLNMQH